MYRKWVSVLFVLVILLLSAQVYLSGVKAQANTFVHVGQVQKVQARPAPIVEQQQTGPTLQIGAAVTTTANSVITVPLTYAGAGSAVNTISFSLDIDQACLAFDPQDQNGDGQPDALRFHTSPSFLVIVATDLADEDGEVDIIIADLFPPFTVFPDLSPLITIRLRAVCQPEAGATKQGTIRFSQDPTPSFGTITGGSLQGTAIDGWVTIVGPPASTTPTPMPTPLPLPTVAPTTTPTLAPTVPTPTPTLIPTTFPIGTSLTHVEFFTATPIDAAIRLDWRTSNEADSAGFYLYRKQVDGQGNNGDFQLISALIPAHGPQGGDYRFRDPFVQANVRYLYLLVEEKRNGARIEFIQLLLITQLTDMQPHQALLPFIAR